MKLTSPNPEKTEHKETILFIHGSGWNSGMWRSQKDFLMDQSHETPGGLTIETVLVDLPGHGKLPGDGCDSVDAYGDAIYETVLSCRSGPCYVAGHSLGGAIALSLAVSYPLSVKGLILIGTGARLRVLPEILDGIMREKERIVAKIVEMAFSTKSPPELSDEAFREMMTCKAQVIRNDFLACDGFDAMEALKDISMPTLILCGTEDALTPPKYSSYLHKAIAGSQLVFIEDAGHMVMLEQPERVNLAIDRFIRESKRS